MPIFSASLSAATGLLGLRETTASDSSSETTFFFFGLLAVLVAFGLSVVFFVAPVFDVPAAGFAFGLAAVVLATGDFFAYSC